MRPSPRAGLTLVELLVALVIFAMIGGAISKIVVNSQRLSREQIDRIGMQTTMRTGALVIPTELREMETSVSGSDILAMGASDITFRAMRGIGFTCQVAPTEIRVSNSAALSFYGYRAPDASRDHIFVFVEMDPTTHTDDAWIEMIPSAVNTASSCGPDPAVAFTVPDFTTTLPNGIDDVMVGGPVRPFEVVRLALYTVNGENWLGAVSVSSGATALQPVLGPLAANGLTFDYLDATGAPTVTAGQVKRILVTLQGITVDPQSRGLGDALQRRVDTLVTTVQLRNAY